MARRRGPDRGGEAGARAGLTLHEDHRSSEAEWQGHSGKSVDVGAGGYCRESRRRMGAWVGAWRLWGGVVSLVRGPLPVLVRCKEPA